MAIYHLSAKTASRSKGQSARAAASYITREGKYARQPDPVLHVESGHMPAWASASVDLDGERSDGGRAYWDAADLYERANGRLFKTVEVALPVELNPAEQRELVVGFAASLTAEERLPWTLAIHAGGGENPHAHLMISERVNDGEARSPSTWFRRHDAKKAAAETGARRSRSLMPRAWLETTREAWADQANAALERAGRAERIDHRSLAAQGIERLPTAHLGTAVVEMEGRGVRTERGAQALAVEAANDEIRELQTRREAAEHERDGQGEAVERGRRVRA